MSGLGNTEVGDFAFDPGVGIFAFNVSADGGDQLADFPHAAVGRAESEAELIGERGHLRQCNAENWLNTEGTEEHRGIQSLHPVSQIRETR